MRFRTWPVAAIGLVSLLLLVVYTVWTAANKAESIYARLDALNSHHRELDAKLRRLRSDVHLSGIFVRDYLLDTEREHVDDYQEQIAVFRRDNLATLEELRQLSGNDERMRNLQQRLEEYRHTFEPLIDWTIAEKITLSARFLSRELIPRREAIFTIAEEIERLNNANLATESAEVTRQQQSLRGELYTLLWRSLLLGVFVTIIAVIRLRVLEARSEHQKHAAQVGRPTSESCHSSSSRRKKRSAGNYRANFMIISVRC